MALDNEEAIKKTLKIDSWRNLSKDKFLNFVSELPNMDKDLAMKVVAQFPEFKSLAVSALDQIKEQALAAQKFNWKGQRQIHKSFKKYHATLNRELERDDVSGEDRFRILQLMNEAITTQMKLQQDHQNFMLKILGGIAAVTITVLGLVAAVLSGGRFGIKGGGGAA